MVWYCLLYVATQESALMFECGAEATPASGAAIVKKTWVERQNDEPELESDADEQLLMYIPYVFYLFHLLPLSFFSFSRTRYWLLLRTIVQDLPRGAPQPR